MLAPIPSRNSVSLISSPTISSRRSSVGSRFIEDPLSSGLVWIRLIRSHYKAGLTLRASVAFIGAVLVSRASLPSSFFLQTDYVMCLGLFTGFNERTCRHYLDALIQKGLIVKISRGRYELTDKAKDIENTLIAKAEECLRLRNEVLAKYSK